MPMFNSLRFKLASLFKAPGYNMNLLRMKNKKFFFNEDKIVGWFDGYPSFTVYTPPLFSKPAVNSLITKVMSLYQWRKLPEIMSIALTDECNCFCEHCSFTSMEKKGDPLTTAELKRVMKEGQDLGISTFTLVGGEPLMHPDILEIIESVDKDISQVVMFTNGYYLEENAKALKKAGLTSVIVSLDSADPARHDEIKKGEGFFDRACQGIKAARKAGLLVATSSVVHKASLANGELVKIFELAKKLGVHENIIFEAIPTGNYSDLKDLAWSKEDTQTLFDLAHEYNKKKKYPGVFPYSYLKSSRSIGCSGGVLYFYVSPYGEVCPCDFNPYSVGNVKDAPIHELWDRFNDANGFGKSRLGGCRRQGRC